MDLLFKMTSIEGKLINFPLPLDKNFALEFQSELLLVFLDSLLEPFVSLFTPSFEESSKGISSDYICGVVSESVLSLPVGCVVSPSLHYLLIGE